MLLGIALALLLTCLLAFLWMPKEIVYLAPLTYLEEGRPVGGMPEIMPLPHIRTNVQLPVLALVVMLDWLALAALWCVWRVAKQTSAAQLNDTKDT